MRNLKLKIEYNGSNFFGWQKQESLRTVQGELERAFLTLTNENVAVEGSGRTDKGVHALGQVASVKIENPIPLKNIKRALNNLLPSDIRIVKVEKAEEDFHARFSAKRKTYRYVAKVGQKVGAIEHNLVGHYPYEVDFEKMKRASLLLIGKHNFQGFCSADTQVQNFEREIFDFALSKKGNKIVFEVTGNGFLYNMVRILVGTLLDVGRGKLDDESVKKALSTGERKYSGVTMPPQGLYLKKVEYDKI